MSLFMDAYIYEAGSILSTSRNIINFPNLYLAFVPGIATVLAYLLKSYGYTSFLNKWSVIISAAGGILIIAAASAYGILENRFGKEHRQDNDLRVSIYYKRINIILLISQVTCVSGFLMILCLLNPYFPLFFLIPYIVVFIIQKLKQIYFK